MKKYTILAGLALALTGCKSANNTYNLHYTLALVIIISIIALFFFLAIFSNMLRDEVNDCDTFEMAARKKHTRKAFKLSDARYPYSLSKVQFAVWTVIISCSFIYLALCKGDCSGVPLSQTALVLMGIGAGVTAASAVIDKQEIQQGKLRHQNAPSDGFFLDLLSDQNGISLHRFQNVVWTVIAMIVYLAGVYSITSGCALPELSQTLLLLTGISSTTYVVLRANENSTYEAPSQISAVLPVQPVDPAAQQTPVITPVSINTAPISSSAEISGGGNPSQPLVPGNV